MKKLNIFAIVLLSGIVLSCTVTPEPIDGTPVLPDSITITSPAANATVGVPFSINGSITGKVVSVKVNDKPAVVNNGTWTITYTSNDMLPLGMKQFDAKGYDVNSNQLVTTSRVYNITNNGSLLPRFAVSGMLTGNYSPGWKAVGILNGDTGYVYGVMNNSNFSFNVNQGDSLEIFAYYDNNPDDGMFESLYELSTITDIVVLNAISNDIETNIAIPDISFYTATTFISNNSFGFPLGIFFVKVGPSMSYEILSSSCSTANDFTKSVNIVCDPGTQVYFGYYIDRNLNNKLDMDFSTPPCIKDSYYMDYPLILNGNTNIQLQLNAIMFSGSVTGNGAADMTGVVFSVGNSSIFQGDIVAGNYQMCVYLDTISPLENNVYANVYSDLNINGYNDSEDIGALVSSGIKCTNENGNNYTLNLVVQKYTLNYTAIGDDTDCFLAGINFYHQSAGASQSFTAYKGPSVTNCYLNVTWDKDKDGIADSSEPGATIDYIISNETTYNLTVNYKRIIVDVTVNNLAGLASYIHPRFCVGGTFYDCTQDVTDCSLTNYWITNKGIPYFSISAYDDINNNLNYNMFDGEKVIATNSFYFNGYVPSTNATIYITN